MTTQINKPATITAESRKPSKYNIQKIILFIMIAGFFINRPLNAQVSVSINISSQAVWGPVGYDYVEYYYLPEADVYYYVPTGQFIYWSGPNYYFVYDLPSYYTVNLYSTYKVVVNEPTPYLQPTVYINRYSKYKNGGPKQGAIRDSKDQKYYAVKGHPNHGQGNSNGNKGNDSKNNKGSDAGQKKNNSQPKSKTQKSGENKNSSPKQTAPRGGKQGGTKQGGGSQQGGKQGGGKQGGGKGD
jgi:uncharacterized membrane protein YgcG